MCIVLHMTHIEGMLPNPTATPGHRVYGTQVLPGHPPRAVYNFLYKLDIKYKMAFGQYLKFLKLS